MSLVVPGVPRLRAVEAENDAPVEVVPPVERRRVEEPPFAGTGIRGRLAYQQDADLGGLPRLAEFRVPREFAHSVDRRIDRRKVVRPIEFTGSLGVPRRRLARERVVG